MSREDFTDHLTRLHDIILAERHAARELLVDQLLDLTSQKENLLKKIRMFSYDIEQMTPAEKKLSQTIYSENLRNAYFFWSALKWVRESMGFIGNKIIPESYEENGSVVRGGNSGILLSGRV